jgi:putative phosphoesterase
MLQRMLQTVTQETHAFSKLQESLAKTVGVISDTHVPVRARRIPESVFKVFENVDFIVHAGDLVQLSVIDELERLAPVLVVHGNMDEPEIRDKLPKLSSFKISDWRIGVMHNPGAYLGTGKMRKIASTNGFNVLVYGHTHSSNIKWERDVLFINPGSPTNPPPLFLAKPSVALLRVTKEGIIPEIVHV